MTYRSLDIVVTFQNVNKYIFNTDYWLKDPFVKYRLLDFCDCVYSVLYIFQIVWNP